MRDRNTDREKKIAEIREALEKATPGPWTKFENRIYGKAQPAVEPIICEFYEEETTRDRNNAHLIANAPEWLRFLLELFDEAKKDAEFWKNEYEKGVKHVAFLGDSFEWLRQERDKLIECLRWYGDRETYDGNVEWDDDGNIIRAEWPPINVDNGQRARDILKEIGVTVE